MAKHVRVDREWHLGSLADALDQAVEADGADWPAALGNEHVGVLRVLASKLAERPHLVTADRMYAGNPVLDTVNVQADLGQFDLLPLQVADLRGPLRGMRRRREPARPISFCLAAEPLYGPPRVGGTF